jgi:hypothetical protein
VRIQQRLFNVVLALGCAYEIVALTTRKVPTITRILRTVGKQHPMGKALLWMWCGYISWHFLEPVEA